MEPVCSGHCVRQPPHYSCLLSSSSKSALWCPQALLAFLHVTLKSCEDLKTRLATSVKTPYIIYLYKAATSLLQPLIFRPRVTVIDRFHCICQILYWENSTCSEITLGYNNSNSTVFPLAIQPVILTQQCVGAAKDITVHFLRLWCEGLCRTSAVLDCIFWGNSKQHSTTIPFLFKLNSTLPPLPFNGTCTYMYVYHVETGKISKYRNNTHIRCTAQCSA